MITLLCVIAAVFVYAFFRERWDHRRAERERNIAMGNAARLAESNRRMELERAFRDGVDTANAANSLQNRFMRQAMSGRGTVKLLGSRGALLTQNDWRRDHDHT